MDEELYLKPELDILKETLRELSVGDLYDLNPKLGDQLEQMGVSITREALADAIVDIKQTSIFQDKSIREKLLQIMGIELMKTWANNSACKKSLDAFGLSYNFLPIQKKKRPVLHTSSPQPQLHEFQDWIKRQVSHFLLASEKNKLMVQMPTGSGKTWTTMESVYDLIRISSQKNTGIVWMAHTDELCEQAIESFNLGWANKGTFDVDLVRLWGGNLSNLKAVPQNPFFCVTSFQTAHSMINTPHDRIFEIYAKIRKRASLLVVDEAHQALAPTYKNAIDLLARHDTKIIGLSATPGRDGIGGIGDETRRLAEYFDNHILTINPLCEQFERTPLQYLQDMEVLSKVENYELKTDHKLQLTEAEKRSLRNTLELPPSVLKRASEDVQRNSLIIGQIIQLVRNMNKKVLVFAPSKDNSDFLASLLNMQRIKARSITGETNFTDRQSAVKMFKNNKLEVLLNYNVFTTGFDDPKIDCVVIARPTASVVLYSQMIGRGLRGPLNGGTELCTIVDVIDNMEQQPDVDLAHDYFQEAWK